MKITWIIVFSALLCTATAGHNLFAQEDISYSFTSGAWGDGFDWPRAQQGYRANSGAVSGDQFDTPDGFCRGNVWRGF